MGRGVWQVVLAVLIVLPTPLAAQSTEQVLIQLERDWDQAFHERNIAFIDNVVADEFIAVYDDGSRGDKKLELENAATFNKRIDSVTLDEFTVKDYGDIAVVWFKKSMTGPMQGVPVSVSIRFVDVFVKRAGRWQCVASQSTRVAK